VYIYGFSVRIRLEDADGIVCTDCDKSPAIGRVCEEGWAIWICRGGGQQSIDYILWFASYVLVACVVRLSKPLLLLYCTLNPQDGFSKTRRVHGEEDVKRVKW